MIICNKISIAPDIKNHPGFPKFVERVRLTLNKESNEKQKEELQRDFDQLIQGVTQTEHNLNVKQAKLQQELKTALGDDHYVVVLIELPCTLGTYTLQKDFKAGVVPVVVSENNMNDFFGDENFVTRFKNHLLVQKNNYWRVVVAAAESNVM